jgi:hypothetical protein
VGGGLKVAPVRCLACAAGDPNFCEIVLLSVAAPIQ